jgi:hypothetical protein
VPPPEVENCCLIRNHILPEFKAAEAAHGHRIVERIPAAGPERLNHCWGKLGRSIRETDIGCRPLPVPG